MKKGCLIYNQLTLVLALALALKPLALAVVVVVRPHLEEDE